MRRSTDRAPAGAPASNAWTAETKGRAALAREPSLARARPGALASAAALALMLAGALALACGPAQAPPASPAAAPASPPFTDPPGPTLADPAPARALPPELAGVVEPWHRLDPAVADASPIWLLTRYAPDTYPHRPGPDGSHRTLRRDRFTIDRVLRGAVAAPGVDLPLLELRGPDLPRGWAAGRRYLLLLRPGPEGQAVLALPRDLPGPGGRLTATEVVAVIDLDEDRAAAEAEAIAVRDAPARWDSSRAAAVIDPAEQRALADLLAREVVRPGATLAEIRGRLGLPDAQRLGPGRAREDQYILARPAFTAPAEGAIYGDLRLTYDDGLALRGAELVYLRWRVEPHQRASVALTPDEHAARGLPRLSLRW